jgi:transketolase
MVVIRPGDANEVVAAYRHAMQMDHSPCVLVMTRQALPTFDRTRFAPASGLSKGAYVLADCDAEVPEIILIATGSEVPLAVAAYDALKSRGVAVRVVSMPSWELFEDQTEQYRQSVLPDAAQTRVAIEQGATLGWERYVGRKGTVIGMHSFGASAPLNQLNDHFGFTAENVIKICEDVLAAAE